MTDKQPKSYTRVNLLDICNIPERLRNSVHWVCWGKRGEGDKTPINPRTGAPAKSTDRNTWGTLGETIARFLDRGEEEKLDGIGFVFSADDEITGIDLDKCRDKNTGEILPHYQSIIEKINSYTEASPSGTGVHIIVQATIPRGRKRGGIEMYCKDRFFCFTGQPITSCREVEGRQEQVNELYENVFGKEDEKPVVYAQSEQARHDPRLEVVRNIPDAELLATMERSEKNFAQLMRGDLSVLKKDESQSAADFMLCCMLGLYTRLDVVRTDKFFRASALYRQKWDRRTGNETYGQRTIRMAFAEIKDKPLYDPATFQTTGTRKFTDGANTDSFIEITQNSFAWVDHWGTWVKWNGTYWQRGADDDAFNSVRRVSDQLWQEHRSNIADKALASWARQSDDYSKQMNVERWARRRLGVSSHTLDQHPELIACRNGIVDLRTGRLRAGERSDWLTRGVEWAYIPDAECPVFENFLQEIMLGNEELVEYLWRVIGYCLTGETAGRAFFILHGIGRNGKSTFARALQTLLGMKAENYAQTARFETFLQGQRGGGSADPDVAGLAGARVVVASEVNPGGNVRLDGARIKQFTGEDWVKARFLYSPEFQFLPVCKIFLVVNHVPQIDETARALYDRLHYIDFQYRVPEDRLDGMLHTKILGEMEGILSKAVRAASKWYENMQLEPPDSVLKAREELAAEMDPWGDFWNELCVLGNGCNVVHKELYAAFAKWCEDHKIRRPPSTITFSRLLRKKGYKHYHDRRDQACWEGIGLRVEEITI